MASRRQRTTMACLALAFCAVSTSASAQDGTGEEPVTKPLDYGFGENQLQKRYQFPDPERHAARVDRRDALDASSDRSILLPTAHTPDQFTVAYTNSNWWMHRLAFSPTDDIQLAATTVIPSVYSDFHAGLSGKITLSESYQHVFSIQPLGFYHSGTSTLANRDIGLGVAALVDLMASDNLVLTFGGTAYGTIWAGTQQFVYDNCESRSDYLDGSCSEERTDATTFPAGGHFFALHAGLTWYLWDNWSLRGEALTGVAAGSVLGSEWLIEERDPADQRDRLQNGPVEAGIPFSSPLTLGAGLAWSNGMWSAQFSGYVYRAPDPFAFLPTPDSPAPDVFVVTPMLNLGVAVF